MTTLPRAVLFDIDGTLALRDETDPNVRHFSHWHRVGEDLPNAAVIELAQLVAESGRYKLIVMSGRDEVCRRQTEMWLDAQGVVFDLREVPRPRHAGGDVVACPNDGCERAFLVKTAPDASPLPVEETPHA